MDGRTAGRLALLLLLASAGCVTTTDDKAVLPPPGATVAKEAKRSGPKRTPSVALMLEFGKMKREQAEAAKTDPEAQSRLRDEARTAYQEALKIDASSLDAFRGLGQMYVQANDYEKAFDTYHKAQAKHPKSATLWLDLAMCHNRRKDWTEAAKCSRKALELEPDNRQAQTTLGLTLARSGQPEEALKHLTRASGPAVAHYNLARMQLHTGQTEQARQNLAVALRENPNLQTAQDLLASLTPETPSGIVQTRGTATLQPPAP